MSKKGSYLVTTERKVRTLVTCDNCTEDQARNDPFEYSTDELELDQIDWRVLKVEENK